MIHFYVLKFSFLRFLSYPFEIFAGITGTIVSMSLLIFFWTVVMQSSPHPILLPQIISYFLIASGLREIVMAQYGEFGGLIGRLVRTGEISNYLMKPTNPIFSLYATAVGRNGLAIFVAVSLVCLGLLANPPQSLTAVFLFMIFLINAWLITFAYNLFEGTMFFYTADASGIRNSIAHIVGIFSGILIPLYLFPNWLESIVKLTPFPYMIFVPINALTINNLSVDVFKSMGISVFWSVVINVIAYWFWKKAVKKYEAIGI